MNTKSIATKGDDSRVKVTLRLPKEAAAVLAERADAAGVPRGDYFATVLQGTPVPPLPVDHQRCLEALGRSTDGLAVVARDLSEMMRQDWTKSEDARFDRFFGEIAADKAVTAHLQLASQLLRDLRAEAAQRSRALRPMNRDSDA